MPLYGLFCVNLIFEKKNLDVFVYSKNSDFVPVTVTVPLPSRCLFWMALPIVHHRGTPVPQRPSPFPTVTSRTVKDGNGNGNRTKS